MHNDVTFEAWQLVKIVKALNESGEAVTLNFLADLARRNAKRTISQRNAGKGKMKEKQKLDLDHVAGGKVDLTRDVCLDLLDRTPYLYSQNFAANRISPG